MAQQKYDYHLSNGKTLTLEGDEPPSDEEVESIAKQQGVQLLPADNAPVQQAITTPETVTPEVQPEKNILQRGWEAISTPLVSKPESLRAAEESFTQGHPYLGKAGSFATDVLYGGTSALNAMLGGAGVGESAAERAGFPIVSKGLEYLRRALSGGVAAEGGYNVATSETWPERITGGLELAGGLFGMRGSPEVAAEIPERPAIRVPEAGEIRPTIKPKVAEGFDPSTLGFGGKLQLADDEVTNLIKGAGLEEPRNAIEVVGADKPADLKAMQQSRSAAMDARNRGFKGNVPATSEEALAGELIKKSKANPIELEREPGKLQQYYDLARGLKSVDLPFMTSAAFRQAGSFAGTKPWFEAWWTSAKAFGSKATAEAMDAERLQRPLFKPRVSASGEALPSIAEESGLKIGDLNKYSKRDEMIRGDLAEKIPVYGKYVASSNRAYNEFINHVATSKFESMYDYAIKEGLDPKKNLPKSKEIADFINTALLRGKLGVEAGGLEVNLERNARLLSNSFFSPRAISSNVRMLNPSTYIMASPQVRRAYLGAMVRKIGMWWSLAELAEFGGAKVSKDPNSADYGKIKIGNTRIDPPGGLQQYLVLGHRMLPEQLGGGGITSSTNIDPRTSEGVFTPFGQGYKPETRFSTAFKFGTNRLHPIPKFAADLMSATQKEPFHVIDQILQLALPMYTADLAEVVKEDPSLLPIISVALASSIGMGAQSYDKSSFGKPTYVPEKYDWNIGAKK